MTLPTPAESLPRQGQSARATGSLPTAGPRRGTVQGTPNPAAGLNVPRLALRWPEEAAQALGVSADTLQRHGVVAELKIWRLGSIRLVALSELERLVAEKSARLLDEEAV